MIEPKLVVVTGRPGAGKTSLSSGLITALNEQGEQFSLITRDDCKVELLETLGLSHDAAPSNINGTATNLFWQQVSSCLSRGQSVVADAAFQKSLWVQLLVNVPVVRMIVCDITPDEALRRYKARAEGDSDWAKFHGAEVPETLIENYETPLGDWPSMVVDTVKSEVKLAPLVEFCLS